MAENKPATAIEKAPTEKPVTVSPQLQAMADTYGLNPSTLYNTLVKTVFPSGKPVTPEQMAMFVVVAQKYGLNPFTREIYAFPNQGGIVPIVSIDGWANIINSHPQFDGIEFSDQLEEGQLIAITATIYRKDRSHPTMVTEYMAECRRDTSTWAKWPARMLRHKSMIQAARYAFGFAGIYDPDEGERILANASHDEPEPGERTLPRRKSEREQTIQVEIEPDPSSEMPPGDAEKPVHASEDPNAALAQEVALEIHEKQKVRIRELSEVLVERHNWEGKKVADILDEFGGSRVVEKIPAEKLAVVTARLEVEVQKAKKGK